VPKNFTVIHVPPEFVPEAWPGISGFVENLSKRSGGRVMPRNVFNEFATAQKELWVVYDADAKAKAFFSLREGVEGKQTGIFIDYLGGENMLEWVDVTKDVVFAQCKTRHIDFCQFQSPRKGWEKVITSLGGKEVGRIYERSFTDEQLAPEAHKSGRNDNLS
jgi:hypothetical protein